MKYRHLFGPVLSRRLGISLGVDLVTHKVCSLNCVYCECGNTTLLTTERKEYVSCDNVCRELDHYWTHNEDPDYITFSGSGEPCLNLALGQVIAHIKKNKPGVKVAVLTNATLMSDPGVRADLTLADIVVPSLDAVSRKIFNRINRPCAGIQPEEIVDCLAGFAKDFTGEIWLEIFILPGVNDTKEELHMLKAAIRKIQPHRVQLNTLDRPGTVDTLTPASPDELDRVIQILDEKNVEIIARAGTRIKGAKAANPASAVLETIHRRPCTKEDLAATLGLPAEEIDLLLAELLAAGHIASRTQARGVFFSTRKEGT
ncbi:MAG: radical SAM protein [Desulfotignum sp.]|jgi:wyosine [tRNA(Phe)-imidazoG37] synthetase (radical SAM superfamily)|nr:radical SAM protein [Desulfotignum sp.]